MSTKTTNNERNATDTGIDWKQRIRRFVFKWLFPIHKNELAQIIPLIVMMFSCLLSYSICSTLKDTMVLSYIHILTVYNLNL